MIKLNTRNAQRWIRENEWQDLLPQVEQARRLLYEKQGPGRDFLGWMDWPETYDREELQRIELAAKRIQEQATILVVVGIGGSYLGARATIEALGHPFSTQQSALQVVYAGNQMSGRYLQALLEDVLPRHEVAINVISKSGTTTEPAVAFRILKHYMENRYGRAEAAKRIYATTDRERGALKTLASQEGYETFVVPDDIGGRYSVLTAVGLLPIAAAGISVRALLDGAREQRRILRECPLQESPAIQYALARNALLRKGFDTEILVNYDPALHYVSEWWKQLYGESEGKDGRGIFPASVDLTTDLHSMGQYIQDGRRSLFETVLRVTGSDADLEIPQDEQNLDQLNDLAGLQLDTVNDKALQATVLAHVEGGVPNLIVEMERMDARNLGALFYFFEEACGISGYLNGVNPFNQPGVEAYKRNMYALLGKPGYESLRAELEAILAKQ